MNNFKNNNRRGRFKPNGDRGFRRNGNGHKPNGDFNLKCKICNTELQLVGTDEQAQINPLSIYISLNLD